jgi:hypothetical protein
MLITYITQTNLSFSVKVAPTRKTHLPLLEQYQTPKLGSDMKNAIYNNVIIVSNTNLYFPITNNPFFTHFS